MARSSRLIRYSRYLGYALSHPRDHSLGRCNICGRSALFVVTGAARGETGHCPFCRSFARNRILVRALLEEETLAISGSLKASLPHFLTHDIWELASKGAVANVLRASKRFHVSEYSPQLSSGDSWPGRPGVTAEDACATSFPDETFDIVISQGVMEHVPEYRTAFREIRRVLRPGGYHIFTVPSPLRDKTLIRAELRDGTLVHHVEPSYHGNPIARAIGSLCFQDFGMDIRDALEDDGYRVRVSLGQRTIADATASGPASRSSLRFGLERSQQAPEAVRWRRFEFIAYASELIPRA